MWECNKSQANILELIVILVNATALGLADPAARGIGAICQL